MKPRSMIYSTFNIRIRHSTYSTFRMHIPHDTFQLLLIFCFFVFFYHCLLLDDTDTGSITDDR
jgi:hypothetical protein